MGKDDRQAFLVGKEDHHHHHQHHHIISAENKQSLTNSLFAWNLFHGSTAKFWLCWFCPANLQGIFHHWFHHFEDLLSFF
jgi:hypothetical protein